MRPRTNKTTKVIRKLFGLPETAPRLTPVDYEERDDGIIVLDFKEGKERDDEVNAWYAEGRRGELAETISDWIRPRFIKARVENLGRGIHSTCKRKITYRKLRDTKRMTFGSPYIVSPDHFSVEGWIKPNNTFAIQMNIVSAAKFADYVKTSYQGNNKLLLENVISNKTSIDLFGNWIFVPDELSDTEIAKAIEGWYKDLYSYSRINRDWAPAIKVEIERSELDSANEFDSKNK